MILLYIFFGMLLAFTGGAPLGASNVAVISTTAKESLSKGMLVAYGAGFGEVILAFLALCYSQFLSNFFSMNPWLQLVFVVLFFLVGLYFVLPKKPKLKFKKTLKSPSRFITGFVLAFANPPVLIYWILVISLLQKYALSISDMSPISVLLLFFAGVFIGKVFILSLYGKWGRKFQHKKKEDKQKLFKYVGIALIALSVVQGIRFVVS